MPYRNHCNSLSSGSFYDGRYQLVADLVTAGAHSLEIWGNARDGFEPYLVSGDSGVSLSTGRFTLRRDCYAACRRAYGQSISIHCGRNWL
jgi:hypothetical protein